MSSPADPFVYTDAPLAWLPEDVRVVTLSPDLASKAELLAALQRELPLPDYFGHNWDALDECLGDLPPGATLVLRHVAIPALSGDDLATYLGVLADAAGDGFVVVFPASVAGLLRWVRRS